MTAKTVLTPKLGNLDLLKASDVSQAWGLNILIYGVSGAGKTTLCGTAQDTPNGRNVLYVDLEGGTMSISDRPDVMVFRPSKWSDLQQVHAALLNDETNSFKTVIIDSLTEAQTMCLKGVIGDKEQVTQQDWGKVNDRLLAMVRAFRSLTHTKGINTIFTALERETRDDATGAVRVGPALTPGSSINVGAAVDSIGYLTWNEKTGQRILHLAGSGKFSAKVRQPMSDKRVPDRMENPSLAVIIDALKGGTNV
jgi:hypothetical protein